MKVQMKALVMAACLLLCGTARAQEEEPQRIGGIPVDVYYLMPSFGHGLVYFYGQAPAEGELNICALDHTLRFKDKDGTELSATNDQNIVKVVIEGVYFLRSKEFFYRQYPVTSDYGVALKRDVVILRDAKTDSYGMVSQTSSVKEYGSIYADGVSYDLGGRNYPYKVSETPFLYQGNTVLPLTKRNLKKLFPERKAEIDAWFKAGHALPTTLEGALELLNIWKPE